MSGSKASALSKATHACCALPPIKCSIPLSMKNPHEFYGAPASPALRPPDRRSSPLGEACATPAPPCPAGGRCAPGSGTRTPTPASRRARSRRSGAAPPRTPYCFSSYSSTPRSFTSSGFAGSSCRHVSTSYASRPFHNSTRKASFALPIALYSFTTPYRIQLFCGSSFAANDSAVIAISCSSYASRRHATRTIADRVRPIATHTCQQAGCRVSSRLKCRSAS